MKLPELSIEILAPHNPFHFVRGMMVVGCLQHDQVVWTAASPDWECPLCGFRPRADAPPLVVKAINYARGTITVG